MRVRALLAAISAAISAALAMLALAATAIAKGGEGLYGKTDDKVITNAGFILIVGFVLLVTGLSIAQHQLQKRKSRK